MSSKESYCPQVLSIGAVTRAVTRAVLIQGRHLQNHWKQLIVVNHFLILRKMESCYNSNVLLFWLTWNPNNQLSGSMVWITKTYLIFDLAGTKERGTDRRLQVQVTSLLISNWDKQFLLKLKLYFRLWLGLGDTLMLFIYHSTVTCTQTCTCELWLVTCILFCACLHYMELDSLMFLAGYAWLVLSINCLSNQNLSKYKYYTNLCSRHYRYFNIGVDQLGKK